MDDLQLPEPGDCSQPHRPDDCPSCTERASALNHLRINLANYEGWRDHARASAEAHDAEAQRITKRIAAIENGAPLYAPDDDGNLI